MSEKSEAEEKHLLSATCSYCKEEWEPFGKALSVVPVVYNLKCPKCGEFEEHTWLDSKAKKLKALKNLGIEQDPSATKVIAELEKRIELVETKLQTLIKQGELSESKVNEVKV
jgi:hypothetical protein